MTMRIGAAASFPSLAAQLSRAPSAKASSANTPAAKSPTSAPSAPRASQPTAIGQVHKLAFALREALHQSGTALKERVEGNGGTLKVGNDDAFAAARKNIGLSEAKSPLARESLQELQSVIEETAGEGDGDPTSLASMVSALQEKMIEQHGSTGHLLNMVA